MKFQFNRRVKLTMKRRGIQSLLKEIKSCNERLDQFIAKADKLEQPATQTTTWKATLTTSLQKIQDYAISLHQALSRAWSCSTQDPHRVYLLLEHRMVRKKQHRSLRGAGGEVIPASFTVSLRSPSAGGGQHSMEVKMMEDIKVRSRFVGPLLLVCCSLLLDGLDPSCVRSLPRSLSSLDLTLMLTRTIDLGSSSKMLHQHLKTQPSSQLGISAQSTATNPIQLPHSDST